MLLLLFHLGGHRFAIRAAEVAAVLPAPVLEPVPLGPLGLAGLFRYQGSFVPVLDLKRLSAGEPCVPALSTRVILVGGRDGLLGLLAEKVTDTLSVEAGHPLAALVSRPGADWLEPMVFEDGEGPARLIRWQALLTPELRALAAPEPESP
jgi:chemotaxis-related protein WspB